MTADVAGDIVLVHQGVNAAAKAELAARLVRALHQHTAQAAWRLSQQWQAELLVESATDNCVSSSVQIPPADGPGDPGLGPAAALA